MTTTRPKPISIRQKAILSFIIRFKRDSGGDSPTYREIMRGVGITSAAVVAHHMNVLEDRGYIIRDDTKARRISIPGGKWTYDPPQEAA